jgi:hypothetical protein
MAASSKRMGNLSPTFEKTDSAYIIGAPPVHDKKAANIIKPMQTRSYWKIYDNGSVNSNGHKTKPGLALV